MNNNLNAKIKLLVKSEKALLALELRKKARETFWIILGVVALSITLILLNITLYLYLEGLYSPVVAAASLTGVNLSIALLFFFIASHQTKSAEAASIEEIRDYAYTQLADEIGEVKEEIKGFKERFTPNELFGVKKFIPIITTILEITKNSKKRG